MLLLGLFPEVSITDGLRPSDPKDSSKACVDDCLGLLQCRSHAAMVLHALAPHSRTCFTVVTGAIDPAFDVDGQDRWGPIVFHLEEGCFRSASSHFYIGIHPPLFVNNATKVGETCHVFLSITHQHHRCCADCCVVLEDLDLTPVDSQTKMSWIICNRVGLPLHLLLGMGEDSQVICKVQVIKMGPRSPLNSVSPLGCRCLQHPVNGQ